MMTLAPAVAWADAGELAIGPLLGATLPVEARAGLAARVGIGDWLAIDARLAAGLWQGQAGGVADLGLIAAWDVLSWVPEVRLTGGGRWFGDRLSPRVSAHLGVRHYLTMSTSITLEGGAEWNSGDDIRAVVSLTVWFAFE
jgi:hypothetical protein